jgi:hypothetical protein
MLRSEQVQLLRQQRDILSRQMREQQLLAPILYGAAGVKPVTNPQTGETIGFEEVADPLKQRQEEVASRLLDRQLAALKGELPDNPALLRDLATQEATLRETLRKELGPGFEFSTAGGSRLRDFMESREGLLEAGRRGDLSLAEQLGIAREQANQSNLNAFLGRIGGVNASPLATAQGFGQAASGYNAPLNQLLAVRQGRMQGNIARESLNQANTAMWLGFTSDLLGAVAGGAGAALAASTGRLKKDIVPFDVGEYGKAMKKLRDTPITSWRYTWEPSTRPPHVGPILELSPRELQAGDGIHVDLLGYAGMLHAGLKSVDRDVKSLRELLEEADKKKGGR